MHIEIDNQGYVTYVLFGCITGSCFEYTGNVPAGYSSYEDWANNAKVQAYYLNDYGNLVHDINKDLAIPEDNEGQNYPLSGEDGFSPEIEVVKIAGGHRVFITDVNGTKYFDVMNGADGTGSGGSGADGEDGFSPIVAVEKITGGHRLFITDAYGTQYFDVMDGKDGTGGSGGSGADGFSPTISVVAITGGHRVFITDVNGTKSFDVMDGKDGEDGQDGASGSGGSVDKSTIVNMIYPVGSIYMSVNATSPASLFGGTWQRIQDTFLLAGGSYHPPGETGGAKQYSLSVSHKHLAPVGYNASAVGAVAINGSTSGGSGKLYRTVSPDYSGASLGSNVNVLYTDDANVEATIPTIPPYLSVYVWKRTA